MVKILLTIGVLVGIVVAFFVILCVCSFIGNAIQNCKAPWLKKFFKGAGKVMDITWYVLIAVIGLLALMGIFCNVYDLLWD